MKTVEDLFQERLEHLEAGTPLELCQNGLPAEEAELLALADSLRLLSYPARNPATVQTQRSQLIAKVTQERKKMQTPTYTRRPRWAFPAMGLSFAAAFLFLCFVLTAVGYGFYSSNRPVATDAVVNAVAGVVEVQMDGIWTLVPDASVVGVGQHIRTGDNGTALLALPDGSTAYLGANTEMWIAELEVEGGQRHVHLAQWSGETRHDVAAATVAASTYLVETPSGTSSAKGTVFSVFVAGMEQTRVTVAEGVVDVTGSMGKQEVTAGKMTSVNAGLAPQTPQFVVIAEGTAILNEDIYYIAGQPFVTHPTTVIAEDIQPGDAVYVEGHISSDGTYYADKIALEPGTGAFLGDNFSGSANFQPEDLDCVSVASVIVSIEGDLVTLENGTTLSLSDVDVLEGTPEVGSSVLVITCTDDTGTVVFLILVVLDSPPDGPTATPSPTVPVTVTVTPSGNGTVTICHYPPGNTANGHTITVGAAAVSVHLAHGDTLGPCVGATPTVTPTATTTPTATVTTTPTITITPTGTITVTATPPATGTVPPTVTPVPPGTATPGAPNQVTLCHIPGGNPSNAHTIVVGEAAAAAHLAHGDTLGACPENSGTNNNNAGNGNNGNGNNGNGNNGNNGNGNNGNGNGNGNNGNGNNGNNGNGNNGNGNGNGNGRGR